MRTSCISFFLALILSSVFLTDSHAGSNSPVIYGPTCAYNLLTHACISAGSGGSGTVTSVGLTAPVGYTAGSAVTTSGNLSLTLKGSQAISSTVIDWSLGNVFTKTISTSTTLTMSNMTEGQTIVVAITNTNTSTLAFTGPVWSGGVAPTQTTGAKTDVYTFVRVGSVTYGSVVQNF